ncbi:SRPBCC family protein [Sphingomonas colocasiae]|uniref:SRPBCC family protein n=1 Tax=Sphingomonas colocasiae TaxID=1848973 RepID=A0ABS7PK04_9SPHN|nr:SRPBCC family protein [Sphingomonas colocasiae]MBY8821583.1 SRPBCC family protein [Sphingomonas colocasiae]
MTDLQRIDRASCIIHATPEAIWRALVDPAALTVWRPPAGMTGRFDNFDAREGGSYRMTLTYDDAGSAHGKSSNDADIVDGRFVELVPNARVVELVMFESDDAAFAGTMKITTSLTRVPGGTEVAIACENVPGGISPEDHEAGMCSTLANLAAYVE